VDFAIPDKKIIVEVHGPSHYIAPSKELNMTSEAKKRLLEKKGWRVVIVPFFVNQSSSDPKFEELMDF
jgi:very-short-patch-repair endonuclease